MERTGGSKLMQMQARFQQKQLQERELKIASLYEAQQTRALDRVRKSPANGNGNLANGNLALDRVRDYSPANGNLTNGNLTNGNLTNGNMANGNVSNCVVPQASPPATIPHHPGKVRQMFEERRTKAGIDKSYPLQPIHNNPGRTRNVQAVKTSSRVVEKTKRSQHTKTTVRTHIEKIEKPENLVNASGDLNHNHEPDNNAETVQMLPQNNGEPIGLDQLDRVDNELLENETFPEAMAPEPTPRSPEPTRPPRRSPANKSSPAHKPSPVSKPSAAKVSPVAKTSPAKKTMPVTAPRKTTSDNTVTNEKPRGAMQRAPASSRETTPASAKKSPPISGSKPASSRNLARGVPSSAGASEGVPCGVCGRKFASDRLAKHQDICKRANTKKRKPFDALKHRLAGTEAEPFISKLRKGVSNQKIKPLNNTWRQKHEDFINAIRSAKQVQAHLNAGGKLSDLPPPPPSENPDYIQCPHCQRRFNQAAAERHIPKCASFNFNKPKPGQGPANKR